MVVSLKHIILSEQDITSYVFLFSISSDAFCLFVLRQVSWFTIDGETFQARPITVTLMPNKLKLFYSPAELI